MPKQWCASVIKDEFELPQMSIESIDIFGILIENNETVYEKHGFHHILLLC